MKREKRVVILWVCSDCKGGLKSESEGGIFKSPKMGFENYPGFIKHVHGDDKMLII